MEATRSFADTYLSLMKNLSPEIKREIIKRLSDSLASPPAPAGKLDSLFGAWQGDETAEEMIQRIRDSRVDTDRVVEF